MANIELDRGNLDGAGSLRRKALAIYQKAFGANHPDVAAAWSAIGELQEIQEDYAAAEGSYRRALGIFEGLDSSPQELGSTLSSLGRLAGAQGDLARAGQLFRRALAVYGSSLDEEHPEIAAIIAERYAGQSLIGFSIGPGGVSQAVLSNPAFEDLWRVLNDNSCFVMVQKTTESFLIIFQMFI